MLSHRLKYAGRAFVGRDGGVFAKIHIKWNRDVKFVGVIWVRGPEEDLDGGIKVFADDELASDDFAGTLCGAFGRYSGAHDGRDET